MFRNVVTGGLLCLMVFAGPSFAGEDAAELFRSVYGADIDRVAATATARDDLELAKSMLEVAKSSDTHPGLLTLVGDTVHDLAVKDREGFPLAIEALNLIADRVPEARASAHARMLNIYESWYRAGSRDEKVVAGSALIEIYVAMGDADAGDGELETALQHYQRAMAMANAVDRDARAPIMAKLKKLRTHRLIYKRVADTKQRIKANPEDRKAVTDLIELYVVELDDPVEAQKYSFLADESTQQILRLATRDPASLAPDELMNLADWYNGHLIKTFSPETKLAMATRAAEHYKRFLAVYPENDLRRSKAQIAVQKLELQARQMGGTTHRAVASEGDWTNLLVLIDPAKDAVDGAWSIDGDSLRGDRAAYARLTIPVTVEGDYEFDVEVRRTGGAGMMQFTLPVGEQQLSLGLGGSDPKRGSIATVEGGTKFFELKKDIGNNDWYHVNVSVELKGRAAKVIVTLDKQAVYEWSGAATDIRVVPMWRLPNTSVFGVGGMHSQFVFRNIRVRMSDGKLSPIRD